MKKTLTYLQDKYSKNQKITMLTCYDALMAKIQDDAGIDCILIGDSLGMVVQGKEDTLSVTVEDIIYHTKAVMNGSKTSFIIADMPFLSYHISIEDTIKNAGKILKETGCDAVKLEGGAKVYEHIKALVNADIPVCAHIGLTPQSIKSFGGFKVQGKDKKTADLLLKDALLVQDAGAFMVVIEGVPKTVGKSITEKLDIPTIGIGAGKHCSGQVLVYQDMLGLFEKFTPKFVKKYANLNKNIKKAYMSYIKEVEDGTFPSDEYSFTLKRK